MTNQTLYNEFTRRKNKDNKRIKEFTTSTSSVTKFGKETETERSWNKSLAELVEANTTYDLSVKNPNLPEEAVLRTAQQILEETETLDADTTNEILSTIKELI